MKRHFIAAMVLFLLLPVCGFAQEVVVGTSGVKTADAGITSGSGEFHGLFVVTDGTNACTVAVYDNTAASGTKLQPTVIAPAGASYGMGYSWNPPIPYGTGIYVDITTSGTCSYAVQFRPR